MADHPTAANRDARHRDVAELFRRYNDQLVRHLERGLRIPTHIAADAAAFAWEQLIRKDPGGDRIEGWLFVVAKHEAFAMLRRGQRETPSPEPPLGHLLAFNMEWRLHNVD